MRGRYVQIFHAEASAAHLLTSFCQVKFFFLPEVEGFLPQTVYDAGVVGYDGGVQSLNMTGESGISSTKCSCWPYQAQNLCMT